MGKYFGKVGFCITKEYPEKSGIWIEDISEYEYYGDIITNTRKWSSAEYLNDNLKINVRISIVADSFAHKNIGSIRYIWYCGVKWKIDSIDIQYPRLILSLGGEYNE